MAQRDGLERSNPLREGCQCETCNALRAGIASDPVLVRLYGKKLLQRSWDALEKAYQQAHVPWATEAAARGRSQIAARGFKSLSQTAPSPEEVSEAIPASNATPVTPPTSESA